MKKKKTITPLDKEFADKVLAGQKKTHAVKDVFGVESNVTAANKANAIMNKDEERKYIESQAGGAAERITDIAMNSENEMVKFNANKDILDRAGFKPQEAGVTINVPMYLPPEILEKYDLTEIKKYTTVKEKEE